MTYFDALCDAMTMLACQPNTIFVGQGVACAGTSMTDSLRGVPKDRLIEFPVAEDFQMGFCIGQALEGYLPVCIFPRWNFALLAANQLVNHLDRIPIYSRGGFKPKVIIRTAVPSVSPFNPGPQHDDDFSLPFGLMFRTVLVVQLNNAKDVATYYKQALGDDKPRILVERTELYRERQPSGVGKEASLSHSISA